ncbi:MAG: type II toxin-antitoxin system VapC family toxin [Actinobacteria bacterium]|nr:type II toxin-antitoxin system VapC family toxin [Actinomycetota bacterium]
MIDWVAPGGDPTSPAMATLRRLTRDGEAIVAPELLFVECANALAAGVRRRRWTGAQADAAYDLLAALPVRAVGDRRYLDRAWEMSRRYDNHPVHDMLYAATADAFGAVFITADEVLLRRLSRLGWVQRPRT